MRRIAWLALAAVALAAWLLAAGSGPGRDGAPKAPVATAPPDAPATIPAVEPSESLAEGLPSELLELFPQGDRAWSWSRVDLDALREEMPDNLYWQMAAPSQEPRVLQERAETRERWNRELGLVLANTATEQQVRDFYAERERLSSDYVAFADVLLERYGDVLDERDVGLIELSRRLHEARLEELPRRLDRAIARRDAHAKVREAWLADQAAFAAEGPEEEPYSQ